VPLGSWLQIKSQAPNGPAVWVSAARSLFAALRKAHNPVELRPVTLLHSVSFRCPKLPKYSWKCLKISCLKAVRYRNHILTDTPARVVVGCALSRDHYLGCYPEPSWMVLSCSTLLHLSPDNHLIITSWSLIHTTRFKFNQHMKLSHTIIWEQLGLDTSRPKMAKNGSNIQEHAYVRGYVGSI